MFNKRSFIVINHLIAWGVLLLFLINSQLKWGWTISTEYDTSWVQLYAGLTNALIFYGTSFYLIPLFYNRHKKLQCIVLGLLLISAISLIELFLDYHIGAHYQNIFYLEAKKLATWNFLLEGFIYVILINLFFGVIAIGYRGIIDKKRLQEKEIRLQKEKLEAELQHLKSQIHPHTLFNGMSSIYHLIDMSPSKAKSLVLNLSNSLRYHLYESGEKYVPLTKELNYLREYIALNSARLEDEAIINVNFDNFEEDLLIAPLLFTPFVENAFKYVSQFSLKEKNKIDIEIKIDDTQLIFLCKNTTDQELKNKSTSGGLGLQNVKSRLQLIYDQQHKLKIKDQPGSFIVSLSISLNQQS